MEKFILVFSSGCSSDLLRTKALILLRLSFIFNIFSADFMWGLEFITDRGENVPNKNKSPVLIPGNRREDEKNQVS